MAQFNPQDKKHLTNIQGTPFITFVGLQKLAADRGLEITGTEFDLVREPTKENGNRALVYAKLYFNKFRQKDQDGNFVGDPIQVGPFGAYGDASPDNVGKAIVPHIIRQAQTRAAAICLRYATRADWTSSVEMGGEDS